MVTLLLGIFPNKATGHDNLSAKLVKLAASLIGESLAIICSKSITMSVFPKDWKMSGYSSL